MGEDVVNLDGHGRLWCRRVVIVIRLPRGFRKARICFSLLPSSTHLISSVVSFGIAYINYYVKFADILVISRCLAQKNNPITVVGRVDWKSGRILATKKAKSSTTV